MPKSSSLSLALRSKGGKEGVASPTSPGSPRSPTAVYNGDADAATPTATATAAFTNMPESPASPKVRKDSKSIFSNFHASKSVSRIVNPDNAIHPVPEQGAPNTIYNQGQNGGSSPDLSRPIQTAIYVGTDTASQPRDEDHLNGIDDRTDASGSVQQTNSVLAKPDDASDHNTDSNDTIHAAKPKKQGILSRTRSIKVDDPSTRTKPKAEPPKLTPEPSATWSNTSEAVPLKTAPLEKGQSWRQNISFSKLRTHSADRNEGSQRVLRDEDNLARKDKGEQNSVASGSYNESRGAQLMSSLGSGARKMGEKMETARKGVFGKLGRSSSNNESHAQVPKEQYVFKVIHLPLVEQTRLTRISSRLENSKDKTEFWMPALPWRCIDYLNMKGCEEEGLYRVPGAAHTVKYYEQKFDQDLDIDLIADENLHDPNVIGSLFKNWLQQLPDEIFPKATQTRISQECHGAKATPQMLKDELSKLPPFNYYLLFAITCHISLLHSCSEFNKMNYNNLCICFQPAIKIDAFCFQFLILDWRNCWQGCWTEKEYLAEEVKLLETQTARPSPFPNGTTPQTSKSKNSSGYLGDALKASSARGNSTDRGGNSTARAVSADRMVSGRATPSNASLSSSQQSCGPKRDVSSDREPSRDRANSAAHSRAANETFDSRRTPSRVSKSLSTDALVDEEDNSATPTQAQHTRGGSESQFRLDLSNPPSSPFSIKF